MKCPNCNATMPDSNKFCTKCGTKLQTPATTQTFHTPNLAATFNASAQSLDAPEVTKNNMAATHHLETNGKIREMAQWSIADNEIARKISEIDFMNICTISGIIIQPGVTAIIYIDGKEALQLNSGIYNFVSDAEVEKVMNMRVANSGLTGWMKVQCASLLKLVLGKKVNEPERINSQQHSAIEIAEKLNEKSLIAIYLKRDIDFPSIYGSIDDGNGHITFSPITIKTRLLDAKIGLQMFLRIADFQQFIKVYLSVKKSVTSTDISKDLEIYVRNILQEELKDEEISDYGISEAAKLRINDRLKSVAQYAGGIEFVRLAEISCNNEVLDRFRQLTQTLYCNEKELDFLHRTNDFKNRLARENNASAIANARTEEELHNTLQQINKDKLLQEDEFEAFCHALDINKFKRENEKEVINIEGKTATVLAQMASFDQISDWTYKLEEKKLQHERTINNANLEMRKDEDAYLDEREAHKLNVQQQRIEMALYMDKLMNEQEQYNLDKDHYRQKEILEKQLAHKESMATIMKDYSAEQMMANQITQMDATAQAEFAKAFSNNKEAEAANAAANATKDIYEKEMLRQAEREERLHKFMENAMHMNVAMAGVQISNAETLQNKYREDANRYREDAKYQQSRVDHTQDKALEYATKSAASRNNDNTQAQPSAQIRCPRCNQTISPNAKFCGFCGLEFE